MILSNYSCEGISILIDYKCDIVGLLDNSMGDDTDMDCSENQIFYVAVYRCRHLRGGSCSRAFL